MKLKKLIPIKKLNEKFENKDVLSLIGIKSYLTGLENRIAVINHHINDYYKDKFDHKTNKITQQNALLSISNEITRIKNLSSMQEHELKIAIAELEQELKKLR